LGENIDLQNSNIDPRATLVKVPADTDGKPGSNPTAFEFTATTPALY
jgi:hypothetical protein